MISKIITPTRSVKTKTGKKWSISSPIVVGDCFGNERNDFPKPGYAVCFGNFEDSFPKQLKGAFAVTGTGQACLKNQKNHDIPGQRFHIIFSFSCYSHQPLPVQPNEPASPEQKGGRHLMPGKHRPIFPPAFLRPVSGRSVDYSTFPPTEPDVRD